MNDYSESFNLGPARLNIADLHDLASIIQQDLKIGSDGDSSFEISAEVGKLRIKEKNLEKFLENKKLPRILTNLRISASGYKKDKYDTSNYVSIDLDDLACHFYITSSNETWFYGKSEQLRNFWKTKRPKMWFLLSFKFFMVVLLAGNIGPISSPFIFSTKNIFLRSFIYTSLFLSVFTLFYMILYISNLFIKFYHNIEIRLNPSGRINYDKVTMIFTILGALLTLLGIVWAIFIFFHPNFYSH